MIEDDVWDKYDIVCGAVLGVYCKFLSIDKKCFEGRSILNFGSGTSNLGYELKMNGINYLVVDYDIKKRSFKDTSGKRYCVLGAKNNLFLPFKDEVFDFVLAFRSTYPNKDPEKIKIFKEFLRIGSNIHIAPVFKEDILLIQGVLEKSHSGHKIVCVDTLSNVEKLYYDNNTYLITDERDYRRDHRLNISGISSIDDAISLKYDDGGQIDEVGFDFNKCGLIILSKV